ncbi:hypothetical protein PSSHI_02820 [Photobacterium sp. R1]
MAPFLSLLFGASENFLGFQKGERGLPGPFEIAFASGDKASKGGRALGWSNARS